MHRGALSVKNRQHYNLSQFNKLNNLEFKKTFFFAWFGDVAERHTHLVDGVDGFQFGVGFSVPNPCCFFVGFEKCLDGFSHFFALASRTMVVLMDCLVLADTALVQVM